MARRVVATALWLAMGACACSEVLGYDEVSFVAAERDGGIAGTNAVGGAAPVGPGGAGSMDAGGAGGLGGSTSGSGSAGTENDAGATETGGTAGGPGVGGTGPESGGTGGLGGTGGAGGSGSAGGSAGSAATGGTGGTTLGDPYEDARQACVDKVNALRASVGVLPLARRKSAEPCVDGQIKNDQDTGVAHGAFGQCKESTQNECFGGNPIVAFIVGCTQSMFDAGPGEGHHDAIVNPAWTELACGIYWDAKAGYFAFAQDFFK